MRIARATAVNRRRSSLKIIPPELSTIMAAAAPEATEGVKMPETAFLQEDETDALRINPFFKRSSSNPEPEDLKSSTSNGGGSDGGSKKKAAAEPSPVKPSFGKAKDMKVSKFVIGPSEEECYFTDHPSRGICLVVSNDEFHSSLQLSQRKGSERDVEAVTATFQNLGFEVRVLPNLKYGELNKAFNNVALREDHSDCDALVVVVLSHGNEGSIYAYDRSFPTQRLWEPFTADNAPSLIGKPKLFFIQACQGSRMDKGVLVTTSPATDLVEKDSEVFASYKVPVHSDFLISHSTISGFYSWRNTANGSWFIQALASVFKDYGKQKRDLLTLLTITSKRVAIEYESSSSKQEFSNKKQTPFFYSTLRYKLFLEPKPGLYSE